MQSTMWLAAGTVSAFFSVALGAFGAHALKERLDARALEIFQTGVHYQFWHALALILLGLWCTARPGVDSQLAGYAFVAGIVLFSGSLYVLALSGIKPLGMITPFGGIAFLIGWATFATLVIKNSGGN